MARKTRNEVLEMLQELTALPVVYKTEVDTVKYHVANVYDDTKSAIAEQFTWAGKWQNLSEAEQAIDVPYAMVHLFGKKFLKSIDTARAASGSTPYLDAVGRMVSDLSLLNTLLQNLIARQTSGRKPVVSDKVVIGTRTQLRAVCPCCFRDQAVNGNRMVSHGYTLDFGYQNGICSGYGKEHFGTEKGRDVTRNTVLALLAHALKVSETAERLRHGDETLPVANYKGDPIENPTKYDRLNQAARFDAAVSGMRSHAAFLQKMVDEWKPKEPREVEVPITE